MAAKRKARKAYPGTSPADRARAKGSKRHAVPMNEWEKEDFQAYRDAGVKHQGAMNVGRRAKEAGERSAGARVLKKAAKVRKTAKPKKKR